MPARNTVTRLEKNRHHLATFLCAIAAGGLLLFLAGVYGIGHYVVLLSGLFCVLVLLLRTVFVELGIRRTTSNTEKKFDAWIRKVLRKRFGIVLVDGEPSPDEVQPSESSHVVD